MNKDLMWIKYSESGESFDVSGILRIETRKDSIYVIGMGELIEVQSIFEGNQLIRDKNNELGATKFKG